jgi:hypothetical protein
MRQRAAARGWAYGGADSGAARNAHLRQPLAAGEGIKSATAPALAEPASHATDRHPLVSGRREH